MHSNFRNKNHLTANGSWRDDFSSSSDDDKYFFEEWDKNKKRNNPTRKVRRNPEKEKQIIKSSQLFWSDIRIPPVFSYDFKGMRFDQAIFGKLYQCGQLISEADRRSMEALFFSIVKRITSIRICYSKQRVAIFFSYFQQGEQFLVPFKDIIKAHLQVETIIEPEFLFGIYNKLYNTASLEYVQLIHWAFFQAKVKNISLRFTSQDFRESRACYRLFYVYSSCQDQFYFEVVNNRHDTASFTSEFIKAHAQNYREFYTLFLKFKEHYIQDRYQELSCNFRSFGEPQSADEEGQKYEDDDEFQEDMGDDKDDKDDKDDGDLKNKENSFNNKDNEENSKEQEDGEMNDQQETKIKEQIKKFINKIRTFLLDDSIKELQADLQQPLDKTSKSKETASHTVKSPKEKLQNFLKVKSKLKEDFERIISGDEALETKILLLQGIFRKLKQAKKYLLSKLPILCYKQQIIEKMKEQSLIIIEGESGSGKSTQLPQIAGQIYEIFANPEALPILVVQPFKIAARTLAKQVAHQMQEKIHNFVSYETSIHQNKRKENSKIIFKLDRLVVEELQDDPFLQKYSCLIIDDAHERTFNTDILLGKVKQILQARSNFKVIVTSNSLGTKLFEQYFHKQALKISGRMHKTTEYFQSLPQLDSSKEKIYEIIKNKLIDPKSNQIKQEFHGHILVFCSGIQEVINIRRYLNEKLDENYFQVVPLHQRMTPTKQRPAFAETDKLKVIITTGFAETITIDGVKVVIDTGYERVVEYNHQFLIYSSVKRKISASSALQRSGRAGRTSKGFCFRLYSESEKNKMVVNKMPEIQSAALHFFVLKLKALQIRQISGFPFMTNPCPEKLKLSIKHLQMIGCLQRNQTLTKIGHILSKCPIDLSIARTAIEAFFFRKIFSQNKRNYLSVKQKNNHKTIFKKDFMERIINILSIISSADIFPTKNPQKQQKWMEMIVSKSSDYQGDFDLFEQIYEKFKKFLIQSGKKKAFRWASNQHISGNGLFKIYKANLDIARVLNRLKIDFSTFGEKINQLKQKIQRVQDATSYITLCLLSGLAPYLCRSSQNPNIDYTMAQGYPVHLCNSSIFSLINSYPKWVICYNLYSNQFGQIFCKMAQKIDFKFFRQAAREYDWDFLKINESNDQSQCQSQEQSQNPFYPIYEMITMKFPTRVYSELVSAYKNRNNSKNLDFLSKYTFIFPTASNNIQIYFQADDHLDILQVQTQMVEFTSLIMKKLSLPHRFEHFGNLQVKFGDGLKIKEFILGQYKYTTVIYIKDHSLTEQILTLLQQFPDIVIRQQDNSIKVDVVDWESREQLKSRLNSLQISSNFGFIYSEHLSNQRFKLPKYTLIIKAYTGKTKQNYTHVFLNYRRKDYEDFEINKKISHAYLIEAQAKLIKDNQKEILRDINIKKSQSGIYLYFSEKEKFDEFNTENMLRQYQERGILSSNFQMPHKIQVFREPIQPYCFESPETWRRKVCDLLQGQGIPQNSFSSYAKGWREFSEGKVTKKYIQHIITVESYQGKYLKMFKRKYNKKNTGIGCYAARISLELTLNVVLVRNSVFTFFQKQFIKLVGESQKRYPSFVFEVGKLKLIKAVYYVMITMRGIASNQKAAASQANKIRELFSPLSIPIDKKFHFMFDKKHSFRNIITDNLKQKYEQVYFIFCKAQSKLLIYAPKKLHEEVKKSIRELMHQQVFVCKELSYRNIPLAKVKDILKNYYQRLSLQNDKQGFYQIKYSKKSVLVTGSLEILQEIEQQINNSNANRQMCDICYDPLTEPYFLMNCQHEFCKHCLYQHIVETPLNVKEGVDCPNYYKCKAKISNIDISNIVGEDCLNEICQKLVLKYATSCVQSQTCYTPDCLQIFPKENSTNKFRCPLCKIEYCTLCKNSHEETQCGENNMNLLKLAVKKCPKCSQGIQKSGGCNHMTCGTCNSHICWNCLKYFDQMGKCYKHMKQKHGGFFDNEWDQNREEEDEQENEDEDEDEDEQELEDEDEDESDNQL